MYIAPMLKPTAIRVLPLRLTDAGVVLPKLPTDAGSCPSVFMAFITLSAVEAETSPLLRSTVAHVTIAPSPMENLSLIAHASVGCMVNALSDTF